MFVWIILGVLSVTIAIENITWPNYYFVNQIEILQWIFNNFSSFLVSNEYERFIWILFWLKNYITQRLRNEILRNEIRGAFRTHWSISKMELSQKALSSKAALQVFLGKGVLKICSKFTGEHPCQSAISVKLQSNFIEIALRHGCPPVNLLHIFRTPFPKNTSEGLLLHLWYLTGF